MRSCSSAGKTERYSRACGVQRWSWCSPRTKVTTDVPTAFAGSPSALWANPLVFLIHLLLLDDSKAKSWYVWVGSQHSSQWSKRFSPSGSCKRISVNRDIPCFSPSLKLTKVFDLVIWSGLFILLFRIRSPTPTRKEKFTYLSTTIPNYLFMYRQLNNLAPVPIVGELVLNQNAHHYETRGSGNVHAQYRHTQKVANSFLNTSLNYWNSLPPNISSALSITTFNKCHKRYIFDHSMA